MSRPHHYAFGHIVLRNLFFGDPSGMVAGLEKHGADALTGIWVALGNDIAAKHGPSAVLQPAGLDRRSVNLGDRLVAVVVALPPPAKSPEAYFAALVHRPKRRSLFGLLGTKPEVARYVTLELGANLFGDGKNTVLCEWAGNQHRNLGPGPEPTIDAFTSAVARLVGAPTCTPKSV